jgi:hypothetical protein
MPSTNLSFRTPVDFMDRIKSRDLKGVDNPGATAKRDLGRWYDVLAEGLREVQVTPDEAVVLIYYVSTYEGLATVDNVMRAGEVLEDYPVGLVDDFDTAKWELGKKYQTWSLAGRYAAWDAAERYEVLARRNEASTEPLTLGMALHRAGLHTYDLPPEILAHVERTPATIADELPGIYLRTAEEEQDVEER